MASKQSEHQTTDRAAARAHEAIDRVAERAGRAEETVRERVSDADERFREKVQHGRERTDDLVSAVGTYVRENPLTSIGLAFAAGALLSSLSRRR